MSPSYQFRFLLPILALALPPAVVVGQELTTPVYRVEANQPQQPAGLPSAPAATAPTTHPPVMVDPQVMPASMPAGATRPDGLETSPFNIYETPGEHPLMPCIRLAQQGLREIDANVHSYSAVLTKRERINGKVTPPQQMAIKVRHEPLGVYVKFIQPFAGREVLYNAGHNKAKLVALEGSGWKRRIGKVHLPVDGRLAMDGQRYPITNTGMRFLTEELLKVASEDIKYGECNVNYAVHDIGGRPCTMIRVVHPTPRKNFRFNIARIFIDHELRIPTGYDAYSWPLTQGGAPELEESYFHTNVVLNPGFTEADFDENNPNLFK